DVAGAPPAAPSSEDLARDVDRYASVSRSRVDDGVARRRVVLLPAGADDLLLAADCRPDRLLRDPLPPAPARPGRRADSRRHDARNRLDRDSADDHDGDLRVGRERLLRDGPAA